MSKITESAFYMWRTLFAVAHVDNLVSDEEVRFMAETLEDVPFSDEQKSILEGDIRDAKDVQEMFKGITDAQDQAQFFRFARELVWIDGDYGVEEQDIMLKLHKAHIKDVDVDALIGNTDLELEEESGEGKAEKDIKEGMYSFRQRFLEELFKK